MLSELLYADDLVLMSDTIGGLRNKFLRLKEAFESKGLKVNHGKTKVMVCGVITKGEISKSNVDPRDVCGLRVTANSVLCLQCGKWIHGRCAGMRRVAPKCLLNFQCRKCEGFIGESVVQKIIYVMKWKQ